MIGCIIGIILYLTIGFFYGLLMLFLIISEDANDEQGEFDSGGARMLLLLSCTIFWIILIPASIIYKLYYKIKGGN